jgi:membrane protease YdiL (CAAX protease family)
MVTLSPQTRSFLSGYGLGIGGAVLALVFSAVGILGATGLGLQLSDANQFLLLFVFGQYLPFIGFPLFYFTYVREMTWQEVRDYLGLRLPSLLEAALVLGGLIAVFALVAGMGYLVQLLGLQPASNSAGEAAQESPGLVPLLIVGSLLVIGPSEEVLFRGTVQNRLRESLSAPVAILLAAVLFASIHVTALTGGLGARATTIVVLLVPSLVFGTVYEYTENLVVPILIHGIWNSLLFSLIWVATQSDVPMGESVLLPLSWFPL